jgi:hypothetical protein
MEATFAINETGLKEKINAIKSAKITNDNEHIQPEKPKHDNRRFQDQEPNHKHQHAHAQEQKQ